MSRVQDLFSKDYKLLIEGGFIACNQGDEASALALFNAGKVLRPADAVWEIGLGYIAMNKMDLTSAAKIFSRLLEREPENYMAQAFLGLTLGLTFAVAKVTKKKTKQDIVPEKDLKQAAMALLKEAKEKSSDRAVKQLANASLSWLEEGIMPGSPLQSGR